MEENTKRDVRVKKLEQKNKELETRLAIVEQATLPVEEQLYNDNPFDDSTSNFNLVAKYHEKPLVDVKIDNSFLKEKEMDNFLLEAHKKIIKISSSVSKDNHVTKISETTRSCKSDNSDALVSSFHGTKVLCDKNKIGEKKARGLIYNEVMKQINILHKKRSQDTGVPLPDIIRDGLCKKIQRAEKIYKLLKKIGLDKIQYIKSYSANEISKFTNDEIQKIMDYFSNKPSTDFSENQDNFINDNSSNQTDTLEVQVNPLVSAKEIDSTSQSVKETNKEVISQLREKTNENKSDNNSDFNDSEEEIPNDSDDDEYNGYGRYNEYGKCDRSFYYCDGRYKRKTFPMIILLR
ncbi:hypothetical protein GLOIN_2v1838494 [Rhizophagus irregularis DAOM 181602=DAOM 197198]|nr:hypothetical protein GLOIN_2v1838494 [Rhizophagus irregularis DAOM 181602=DAOM 197198]